MCVCVCVCVCVCYCGSHACFRSYPSFQGSCLLASRAFIGHVGSDLYKHFTVRIFLVRCVFSSEKMNFRDLQGGFGQTVTTAHHWTFNCIPKFGVHVVSVWTCVSVLWLENSSLITTDRHRRRERGPVINPSV